MERALPKAGETWLHFKNKRYEIIALSRHPFRNTGTVLRL